MKPDKTGVQQMSSFSYPWTSYIARQEDNTTKLQSNFLARIDNNKQAKGN